MSRFAVGKHARGISDRSGASYLLRRMKKEWTGALVGYDEWEQKHPQLDPRHKVVDPQALKKPRPDRVEPMVVYVDTIIPEIANFKPIMSVGQVGAVTVAT